MMTSLQKQWQNLDLSETKQIIYHCKGFDKSHQKMHLLLDLSHFVKKFWAFMSYFGLLTMLTH